LLCWLGGKKGGVALHCAHSFSLWLLCWAVAVVSQKDTTKVQIKKANRTHGGKHAPGGAHDEKEEKLPRRINPAHPKRGGKKEVENNHNRTTGGSLFSQTQKTLKEENAKPHVSYNQVSIIIIMRCYRAAPWYWE